KRFLGLRLDTANSRSSIDNNEFCTPTTHPDNQGVTPQTTSPWRIPSLDSPTNGISIDDEPIPNPCLPPTTNSPIGRTFISPRPPPTLCVDGIELNGERTSSRVSPVEASRNYYPKRVFHDKSQREGSSGVYGPSIFTQSSIDLSAPRSEMYAGTEDPGGLTVDDTTLSVFGRGPGGGQKGRAYEYWTPQLYSNGWEVPA
ncbi:1145_t:CDS:2, partial [Acaulospora colombiana]